MTRKDKVKELVGRGLNSYHAKALQQIDRINKKNKEQNHKISILTNELDNDYLTKTEEGSVVSLEHSKEGMVYLDELKGNTMVNYCTDGSKEMILNGDIDVEGAFITTTEGVDDGKVDVMCEGNTLVNLASIQSIYENTNLTGYYMDGTLCETSLLKLNTVYTLIIEKEFLDGHNENYRRFELGLGNMINVTQEHPTMINSSYSMPYDTNKFETKIVTLSFEDFKNYKYLTIRPCRRSTAPVEGEVGKFRVKIIFLEGDWTNKEIPTYFEGMKSVGQDDENGHKIEISSRNKNILSPVRGVKHPYFIKKGTRLVLSEKNNTPSRGGNVKLIDANGIVQWFAIDAGTTTPRYITTNNDIYYMENALDLNNGLEYQVEIGTERTPYVPHKSNKKEISINEPLRSLPNRVKDKFVKIGGKWFVERNCGEYVLTNLTKEIGINGSVTNQNDTMVFSFNVMINKLNYKQLVRNGVCDKFTNSTDVSIDKEMIYFGQNINIRINKTKLTTQDLDGFIKWLEINPVKMVYQLETPIYEPLEIEPVFNTYLDATHISNNSIIPCNMKIKNTGYPAIIKPSTLYTIALDTNKSGTIGMNLGGAKGTTTSNVATITTPATLLDDSLRVSGKGIKGSKLRLLEGDKTNWIPSHFEGMRSCFEDKLQDNGRYKMEILSVNEHNLLDISSPIQGGWSNGVLDTGILAGDYTFNHFIEILPNVTYRLETKGSTLPNWKGVYYFDANKKQIGVKYYNIHRGTFTFIPPSNAKYMIMWCEKNVVNLKPILTVYKNKTDYIDYTELLYNKIQFSSIEPLKKWDRFVFKDGKLMIERYSKKIDLGVDWTLKQKLNTGIYRYTLNNVEGIYSMAETICNTIAKVTQDDTSDKALKYQTNTLWYQAYDDFTLEELKKFFTDSNTSLIFKLKEPTYEEIPYDLQKIILEGYKNGTLFFDTNIPPTATITYAGETPVASTIKENKVDISKNTEDINENIIPYLMDMDYRVAVLYLQSENISGTMNVSRVFGGVKEMLIRDIKSKRYSAQEYLNRISTYHAANKITIEEMEEIKSVIMEVCNG